MINNLRTMSQYDPKRGDTVAVLGVGALGSKIAMELASLGVRDMMVYDFDKVEAHNLSNQAYFNRHIGMYKQDAIEELINEKTNNGCKVVKHGKLDEDTSRRLHHATHVFLSFDSFEMRILALQMMIKHKVGASVFDSRIGAFHGNCAVPDRNLEAYLLYVEGMLEQRTEPETSACGLPISLGFTSSVMAATITSMFVQHCAERLPFAATEQNLASFIETGVIAPWEV